MSERPESQPSSKRRRTAAKRRAKSAVKATTPAERQWVYPYPLIADPSVLRYVLELGAVPLCLAPWRAVPLVCQNCPEPHMVGLAYCRIGDGVSPWALYMATSLGRA